LEQVIKNTAIAQIRTPLVATGLENNLLAIDEDEGT